MAGACLLLGVPWARLEPCSLQRPQRRRYELGAAKNSTRGVDCLSQQLPMPIARGPRRCLVLLQVTELGLESARYAGERRVDLLRGV